MGEPTISETMAKRLYVRVYAQMLGAHGRDRVELRAMLELPAEPCRVWEFDGTMHCSTHSEFWHKGQPKPAAACFVDQEWEPVASSPSPERPE